MRITSNSSDGSAFMCSTRMPSRTGSVQARTPGAPSTETRQLGHCPAQHSSPRRRWYLNEREKVRWPPANSADPIVSPSKPGHVTAVERERDLRVTVDALAALLGKAASRGRISAWVANTSSTGRVQCTSFVRVSRSAMNHSPQPERCSHHSCCTPATLRRK